MRDFMQCVHSDRLQKVIKDKQSFDRNDIIPSRREWKMGGLGEEEEKEKKEDIVTQRNRYTAEDQQLGKTTVLKEIQGL